MSKVKQPHEISHAIVLFWNHYAEIESVVRIQVNGYGHEEVKKESRIVRWVPYSVIAQ